MLEAHLGNVFHDIFQSKRFLGAFVGKGYGASWQDYFLSLAGMELGMDIASGDIATPHELCPALHTRLGPAGPGSDGAVDWWRTHWDIHPDAVPDIMPLACMTSEWGIECLPDWSWGPDYE